MTIQWNTDVYTQERSIMRITEIDENAYYVRVLVLSSGLSGTVVKYSIPSSRNLDIDFSDLVRLSATGMCSITQNNSDDVVIGSSYTMRWTQAGRINPTGVLIPECDYGNNALIVPPLRMISSYGTPAALCFEFYKKTANTLTMREYDRDALLKTSQIVNGSVYLDDSIVDKFRIENDDTGAYIERQLVEWECGKRYALVEWESFTGATRRHVFEVVKQTSETSETISLENILNEWTEIKGRADGFTLRLEDLTRYDLWYYSDLITSSNVRVSIDNGATFFRVQVAEKKYTIPDTDAGRLSTLEIPIKFRRYDTL